MISEFLEKNAKGFNYGNFIIQKIHLSLILMVLAGFLYLITDFIVIAVIQAVIALVFFYSLLIEIRKKFSQEFKYFVFIYGLFFLVVQTMWLNNFFIPEENRMDVGFLLIFVLIVIAVVFSIFLKKNFVKAIVLSSNGKITVIETEFDLRSFTKGGKHIIETEKKFKENQEIKVKIKKGIFGKKIEII